MIKKAQTTDLEFIYSLIQKTIKKIYPKYYTQEAVDFFSKLHSRENIEQDIKSGFVFILINYEKIIGTGTVIKNHINRLFIYHEYQGRGYGSILLDFLENYIRKDYDNTCLDSSLPASRFYEKHNYITRTHEKIELDNEAVLVYEIMEKELKTEG